jgi:SH3-like domain-containing protein
MTTPGRFVFLIISCMLMFSEHGAIGKNNDAPRLPRFACVKSSKANLHVGPGLQYPVDWVLTLKRMPVQIVSEYGPWRRIKVCDGTVGWVHKSVLSSKKTAMFKSDSVMFHSPSEKSKKIAQVGRNVAAVITKVKNDWTKVLVFAEDGENFAGWVQTQRMWGAVR